MMTEHTPTPWNYFEGGNSIFVTGNETFEFGGNDTKQHIGLMSKNYGETTSTSRKGREEANAKFIVTACNNHDALVRVLRAIKSHLDAGDNVPAIMLALANAGLEGLEDG